MLNIKVINKSTDKLNPVEMLENKYSNRVFQQYANNVPQNHFYINCGINEEAVIQIIQIWFDDENYEYQLSTSDKKDLSMLLPHIKVVKLDAKINLTLEF